MTVRLLLFGSPTVEHGASTVALPYERRNQLLAFLALKRSWVGRAELAGMLWPEQQTKLAYTNLRKILHRLQSLPWARGIESQGAALRFEAETDIFAFESAIREQRLIDALALRRGELLAGFDDDRSEAWSSWLNFERDRLRVLWRDAALNRLGAEIDPAEGIELSAQLLGADPLDEAALRAHVSWLARGGQTARARQAHQDFVTRLEQELGLAPSVELQALHDSLGTTIPRLASAQPPVPSEGSDFIGRTVELRRIATLLQQDDCRLVSVIGPGGMGKTRLAQRLRHQLAQSFADGAAFVPLEDLSSISEVGSRLARELEVKLGGQHDPLDQIINYLRDRQMLLVLDNFEHLAGDAAVVEKLLQSCPQLKLLVTSRVRLLIAAEWLFPLEGLPWPDIEDEDRFEAFDAVRLFVQAAQRVQPGLVPAAEAASIVEICHLVGGLPLALELAAAWTRVLSCGSIAAELRHGTELLRAVDATHPQRHASIEMVFDQSWQLLSDKERDALARLSVFHGGFSSEAARAVAGASLPVLGALADKSLLRKDGARIFMHPLVQQLAALRLDVDARASTERSHAQYFHRMLAQSRRPVEDGDREAMQRIDTEFENCRTAWKWSIAHAATDAVAKSAPTLLSFCDHRNRFEEGLSVLREALEAPAVHADAKLAASLLSQVAHLKYRLDRYAEAEADAARALVVTRHSDDLQTRLQCFKVLGSCSFRVGKYADAKRFYQQALKQAPASVDPNNAAAMLDNLALVEKSMGRYDESLRLSIQSLAQHRIIGDVAGEALCLNNLAALFLVKKDYKSATKYLAEGLGISERHGLVTTRAYILANLTEVALNTNDNHAAAAHASRALEAAESIGHRAIVCWVRLQLSLLALRRSDLTDARSQLSTAMSLAIAVGMPTMHIQALTCFAEILHAQGETSCARQVLEFADGHPSTRPMEREHIRALLAKWPSTDHECDWPELELDELLHRIVVESDMAYAPLLSTLRGALVH